MTAALNLVRSVLLLATLSGVLHAQEINPRELLEASARAHLRVRTASYHARAALSTSMISYMPEGMSMEAWVGDITMERLEGSEYPYARLRAEILTGFRTTLIFDGRVMHQIKTGERTVERSEGKDVGDNLKGSSWHLIATPLFDPAPFRQDLESADINYAGRDTVDGIECHVVSIGLSDTKTRTEYSRWYYLAVVDSLVRRHERRYRYKGTESRDVVDLLNLRTNLALAPESFALDIPEAFTVIEYRGFEPPTDPLVIGEPVPDWTLTDRDGQPISLSDFKGRLVLIQFWGTWCPSCMRAMPVHQQLQERFADRGLVVIGINFGESPSDDPVEFMRRFGLKYRVALDGESTAVAYTVDALPATFLIGPDGRLIQSGFGSGRPTSDAEIWAKHIENALGRLGW